MLVYFTSAIVFLGQALVCIGRALVCFGRALGCFGHALLRFARALVHLAVHWSIWPCAGPMYLQVNRPALGQTEQHTAKTDQSTTKM